MLSVSSCLIVAAGGVGDRLKAAALEKDSCRGEDIVIGLEGGAFPANDSQSFSISSLLLVVQVIG